MSQINSMHTEHEEKKKVWIYKYHAGEFTEKYTDIIVWNYPKGYSGGMEASCVSRGGAFVAPTEGVVCHHGAYYNVWYTERRPMDAIEVIANCVAKKIAALQSEIDKLGQQVNKASIIAVKLNRDLRKNKEKKDGNTSI